MLQLSLTLILGMFLIWLWARYFRLYRHSSLHKEQDHMNDIYSLTHGRLNLKLPTETMWMNMGYW